MKKRKICFFTATRAEYGLLYWLLKELRDDSGVDLQIIASGTHLSPKFGMTVQAIEEDGFKISARIPLQVEDDTPQGITCSLAQVTAGMGDVLAALQPDLLVLLGDRFEILGAAQAALIAKIPIAHIHGGESSEGLIDEAVRHSVTKMAHLHFVSSDQFRKRVIQLGESPEYIWTVGATGLDNIKNLKLLTRSELEDFLGINLRSPSFLFTYHPVTLDTKDQAPMIAQLLNTMIEAGGSIIITGVNADTGSSAIREKLIEFAAKNRDRVVLTESMGSLRYLSAISQVDVVVGNSSSGLIEAPSLGTPTINIGERQRGRPQAPSVIQCESDSVAFRRAIKKALSQKHRQLAERCITPYGNPGAASRIASVIRAHNLDGLLYKKFHDILNVELM